MVDKKDIERRILFYWSKIYSSSIKSENEYNKLEKTIVILIADYNLENLKEFEDYMTKWNIRGEKYSQVVLTDVLEIYIIELRKAENQIKEGNKVLKSWLEFINNPKAVSIMENKEIKKAKEILEEISQDEREQRLAELREKYRMDQNAVYGRGYEVGEEKGKKEIAKKMKDKGMDIESIIEITGLTKQEIEKL